MQFGRGEHVARVLREDLKQRVREANDIVDVVGAVVKLKRAGKSHKGLCPFHNEKTPSFTVNTERQTFKCFGCGEGGDVFTFVEKSERVEFKEALAILAERAGIAMVYSNEAREAAELAKQRKLHIYRAQSLAERFFVERLAVPEGRVARDYLKERALDSLSEEWGLGFAPDRWDGLTGKFATSAPKERLLVAAGLAKERESGGVYDTFRNRLMFPIHDTQGRIVGFGGRLLGEGDAKYLNTPETAVFSKGKLLYGLDRAREEIGRSGTALVVEGYTDVIRCHEHGFTNAVASLGTALTADHLRLLRRMGATKALLVFDADAAGLRAAERGLEILFEEDFPGAVVTLEDGLDPCDFLAERGPEAFAEALGRARDAFEFKISQVVAGRDISDLNARTEAAHALMETASRSSDPVKRALLRRRVAERLDVPEETLAFPTRPGGAREDENARAARSVSARPGGAESLDVRAERELAALLAAFPAGVEIAEEEAWEGDVTEGGGMGWAGATQDPLAQAVMAAAVEVANSAENTDAKALLDRLSADAVTFAVDAMEQNDGASHERMEERVRKSAIALWLRRAQKRLEELTAEVKSADKEGDEDRHRGLLRERQELLRETHERRTRSDPDARRRAAARKG
ncbi:MAG: DNA primase [Planctomycetota bacterium]|jgi:DNA primase